MLERLDTLFLADERVDGENASPDITGLIGQYVHGNEPSHHITYLYTMAGEPRKTAEKVREVLYGLYTDGPEGIAGNEDCGEISAWYILSSMGIFQPEPGSKRFWFGSPIFDSAEIDVPGGVFRIVANGNGKDHPYIGSVKLNGEPYDKGWIDYDDIMKGGVLEFTMTD
jgi:putative alpha-1,2-mannosidase